MIQNNQPTDDLLSSRLKNNRRSRSTQNQPNLGKIRPKQNDGDTSSVPTYGAADDEKPRKAESFSELKGAKLETPAPQKIKKKHKAKLPSMQTASTENDSDKPATRHIEPEPEMIDAAAYDDAIEEESYISMAKQQKREKTRRRLSKAIVVVASALCIYFVFLIYGVAMTNYVYNAAGQVEPEVLSVEDLRTLNQYNALSGYYLRTRVLYEKVLTIDYELATDAASSSTIAREYLGLLDEVSKLASDINAAQLDIEYTGIISRMYDLVYTHIAVYLQNMNGALEGNNVDKANQALQGREVITSEFATLTENMAALCSTTHGAKNGDIFDWSPTSFVASLGGEQ